MDAKTIIENGITFLKVTKDSGVIATETDALDLVSLCGELNINQAILFEENLSPDFFDLKTGLAGGVLLKFSNYQLQVAVVVSQEIIGNGHFQEFVMETNRHNQFGVFTKTEDAIFWLVKHAKK
jgi:hypothetical protein